MVKSLTMPLLAKARNKAKAKITEVNPTPTPMPVLAPMYRPVADKMPPSKKPVSAERSVSWAMSPR